MNRLQCAMIAVLVCAGASHARGDQPASREGAAEIMKAIQGLEWQDVNFDALSPLDRCRTLMLLNHALGDVGKAAMAEVDLMHAYIAQKNLTADDSAVAAAQPQPTRSYEDARMIAAALLAGPMSDSRYASALADADDAAIAAHEGMYDKSSRKKWDEFVEPVREVRRAAAFLKEKGQVKDYMAWAKDESDRRQAKHDQEMADRRAAAAEKSKQDDAQRQAQAAEREAQRQEQAEMEQAQRALFAAQMAEAAASAPRITVVEGDDDDDDWYLGWYQHAVANARNQSWHRSDDFQDAARARAAARVGNTAGGKQSTSPASGKP